ncbi:hypothetical protein DL93DRAFT_697989 [Clavulina sp. PMI_390]|nr:hypothetical protein DL93DRAFT_697989 [Clavulina sp. PMI_390]
MNGSVHDEAIYPPQVAPTRSSDPSPLSRDSRHVYTHSIEPESQPSTEAVATSSSPSNLPPPFGIHDPILQLYPEGTELELEPELLPPYPCHEKVDFHAARNSGTSNAASSSESSSPLAVDCASKYLFKYGFFCFFFWILAVIIMLFPIQPPIDAEDRKCPDEESARPPEHIDYSALRQEELKWGRRSLAALIILFILVTGVILIVVYATHGNLLGNGRSHPNLTT